MKRTAPVTTANGLVTSDMARAKCDSRMVQSMKEIGTWDMPMVKVPLRMKLVRHTLGSGTITCVTVSASPSTGTAASTKDSGLRMRKKEWESRDGRMAPASKALILMAKRMDSACTNGKMVLRMRAIGSTVRLMGLANIPGQTTVSSQENGKTAK